MEVFLWINIQSVPPSHLYTQYSNQLTNSYNTEYLTSQLQMTDQIGHKVLQSKLEKKSDYFFTIINK